MSRKGLVVVAASLLLFGPGAEAERSGDRWESWRNDRSVEASPKTPQQRCDDFKEWFDDWNAPFKQDYDARTLSTGRCASLPKDSPAWIREDIRLKGDEWKHLCSGSDIDESPQACKQLGRPIGHSISPAACYQGTASGLLTGCGGKSGPPARKSAKSCKSARSELARNLKEIEREKAALLTQCNSRFGSAEWFEAHLGLKAKQWETDCVRYRLAALNPKCGRVTQANACDKDPAAWPGCPGKP